MSLKFDVTKVNEQYHSLELKNLSGYEIQALGKLLIGLGEIKTAKEAMESYLVNMAGTGSSPNGLN